MKNPSAGRRGAKTLCNEDDSKDSKGRDPEDPDDPGGLGRRLVIPSTRASLGVADTMFDRMGRSRIAVTVSV